MRAEVETGSRLHGGFYYAAGDWNVRWGSIGFYVDKPKFRATVELSDKEQYRGPQELLEYVRRAARAAGVQGFNVEVHESPPVHRGFGAGTQALLSLYMAFKALKGEQQEAVEEAALKLGRAKHSGAGTLAFKYGGFVMDAGLPGRPRPLITLKVPSEWRFVIVVPNIERGLTDEEEESIMERKQWGNSESNIAFMTSGALRLAAGIARGDLDDALEGLRLVQRGTGILFTSVQGGEYRGKLNDLAAEAWRSRVILAQSSWGPTMYTIVENEYEAQGDVMLMKEIMSNVGLTGEVIISPPRNYGASIKIVE